MKSFLLIALIFAGLQISSTAMAGGLGKYYECQGVGANSDMALVVDLRKGSSRYQVFDRGQLVETVDRQGGEFVLLSKRQLQVNRASATGPEDILLRVMKLASGVQAYHYQRRAYFNCTANAGE